MKYVRIIDSTYVGLEGGPKKMIGDVVKVHAMYFHNSTICVNTKDETGWFLFNLSDVQECVLDKDDNPVYFDGEPICVGDEVDGREVIGWHIYDNITVLRLGSKSNTYEYDFDEIETHTPKHKTKKELIVSLKEVAEKFGVDVKNLKIKE